MTTITLNTTVDTPKQYELKQGDVHQFQGREEPFLVMVDNDDGVMIITGEAAGYFEDSASCEFTLTNETLVSNLVITAEAF